MSKVEHWNEPHAFIQGVVEGGFGHVNCHVSLDSDILYKRVGALDMTTQIGSDYDLSIRSQLANVDERTYACKISLDARCNGLTAERAKAVYTIISKKEALSKKRYDDACDRNLQEDRSVAGHFLDLCLAAKVRYVYLNDRMMRMNGMSRSKGDCPVLDLKNHTDIAELRRVVGALRDQIWETVIPAYKRADAASWIEQQSKESAHA